MLTDMDDFDKIYLLILDHLMTKKEKGRTKV